MLDMGFAESLLAISKYLPTLRRTWLFSATYREDLDEVVKQIQKNPISLTVNSASDRPKIEQIFYLLEERAKIKVVHQILKDTSAHSVLVFSETKLQCNELASELMGQGYSIGSCTVI